MTAIFVMMDITERKRAEGQLKSVSEQLRALSVSLRHARYDAIAHIFSVGC